MNSIKSIFVLSVVALSVSACGTMKRSPASGSGLADTKGEGGLLGATARSTPAVDADAAKDDANSSIPKEVAGVALKNRSFDFPVVVTPEVERQIHYFTGSARKHFAIYLERMARYEPVIRPRLKAAGVPEDLIYLALIESGFSTAAKSRVGAVGPWQFMKSTGKRYGLDANWWVDERRDPVKSTDAAIDLLSNLHMEFGDWLLACSAYNAGPGRVKKAISKLKTKDFWTIARNKRALRRETKDYVPRMMAAAIIAKNAEQFGFTKPELSQELLEVNTVSIPKTENLRAIASVAGVDRDTILDLNPELTRCCTPLQKGEYLLKVPKGEAAQKIAAAVEAGELGAYSNFRKHIIRKGDSISSIAKKNSVPAEAILAMNEIASVRGLKLGTELIIPDPGMPMKMAKGRTVASSKRRSSSRSSVAKNQKSMTYVVKQGDTLHEISRRYAVRVEEIRRWNSLRGAKNLRPGRRLKLYVKNDI